MDTGSTTREFPYFVTAASFSVSNVISISLITVIVIAVPLILLLKTWKKEKLPPGVKLPPHIPNKIPFMGYGIEFNNDPVKFLHAAYKKYGEIFSFTMFGQTFTYLASPDASALLFNTSNDILNAEDVYGPIIAPIYGEGVAFGAPYAVFKQQKAMVKMGLTLAHYKHHVPIITNETQDHIEKWGKSGKLELYRDMSELLVFTTGHCLHGSEMRGELNNGMADLYSIMDKSLNYLALIFPKWIPFPTFIRRDRARKEIQAIFNKVINRRREVPGENDLLQLFIDGRYKNGRSMTNFEIAGMCIGLMHAGVHTSSCVSSWMGFYMAQNKDIQDACYKEQMKIAGESMKPITYENINEMELLHRVMEETLRLRPPLMSLMRNARSSVTYKGYTIPVGHRACVSPSLNGQLRDFWGEDVLEFKPDRWLKMDLSDNRKYMFCPFGQGHHMCIGQKFAYIEIKAIWGYLLREFEFDLVDEGFPEISLETMVHIPDQGYVRFKSRKVIE